MALKQARLSNYRPIDQTGQLAPSPMRHMFNVSEKKESKNFLLPVCEEWTKWAERRFKSTEYPRYCLQIANCLWFLEERKTPNIKRKINKWKEGNREKEDTKARNKKKDWSDASELSDVVYLFFGKWSNVQSDYSTCEENIVLS